MRNPLMDMHIEMFADDLTAHHAVFQHHAH